MKIQCVPDEALDVVYDATDDTLTIGLHAGEDVAALAARVNAASARAGLPLRASPLAPVRGAS